METLLTVTVAVPPSVAWMVRLTEYAAPLRCRCTGCGQLPSSGAPWVVQAKVTVTGLWYQP